MQEYQVTLEGETLSLPEPFIVIATQNPIEYEGTFPLPEAQLDRFMVKLSIGYPRPEEEDEILKRRAERKKDIVAVNAIISAETFLGMRAATEEVYVDPDVRRYMVDLAAKSRFHRQVAVGISPRGSLALLKLTLCLGSHPRPKLCRTGRCQAIHPTCPRPPHHSRPQFMGYQKIRKCSDYRDIAIGFRAGLKI